MGNNRSRSTVAAGAALSLIGAYAAATVDSSKASAPEPAEERLRALPLLTVEAPEDIGAMLAGLSERTALQQHTTEQAAEVPAELAPPQVDPKGRTKGVPADCRPAGGLLSKDPVREFGLPGGASVRIWDTGARPNPMDETRLVAVRIPKGTLTPTVLTPSSALGSLARPSAMADDHNRAVVVINGGVYDTSTNIPTGALATDDRARKADSVG
ncbi:MAG TPA: hypothetical protein VNC22_03610, partial [Sporichthya sp.]|nr:hypothetical protein [Sporichthya sp.]